MKELFGIFEEKLLSILHMFADPKPGVPEVISRLRTKGYAIGSTTGYTDKMMEIVAPAAKEGVMSRTAGSARIPQKDRAVPIRI